MVYLPGMQIKNGWRVLPVVECPDAVFRSHVRENSEIRAPDHGEVLVKHPPSRQRNFH